MNKNTTPTSGAADLPEALIYADLPKHVATGLGEEYESFDQNGRPMGKAYQNLVYYTEDQMRAFADATYMLRASHGQAPASVLHLVHSAFAEIAMAFPKAFALHKVGIADTAVREALAAPAPQQAGEVRRAELVPGVMHCAKCKFQLNRVTLCVSDGNAYAGNNKTEPCPNGCGPLWPVTWEQEAKNCWKALEEMHERLMAAAAPQPSPTAQSADSVQEDAAQQPRLTVRLTAFPESNGKQNWTALLVRADKWDGLVGNCGGISLARGELWNRVAYGAECARFLIGERDTEPFILDYGDDIKTPEEWKGEVYGGRKPRGAARKQGEKQ